MIVKDRDFNLQAFKENVGGIEEMVRAGLVSLNMAYDFYYREKPRLDEHYIYMQRKDKSDDMESFLNIVAAIKKMESFKKWLDKQLELIEGKVEVK